jgi:two-component system chemotaxis response regulator CheB
MPRRDIYVVGASVGGVVALQRLVSGLPSDFPGSVFVVLHMSPHSMGILPDILARAGPLPAGNAQHGEKIEPGRIYVAPPDRHLLLVQAGRMQLGHGPKENGFRPAVDPLFRSAAFTYGLRATGIVLTGGLDDGTAGLWAIKQAGGLAIVQDPAEAEAPSMPRSALRHVSVDYCLGIDAIAALLPKLAAEPYQVQPTAEGMLAMSKDVAIEVRVAADERNREGGIIDLGTPSLFTCPECHGSLLEVRDAVPPRFRCHTGHAFTAVSLEAELSGNIEMTAWNTVRALEEHAMLLNEMAGQPDPSDEEGVRLRAKAERALKQAARVRQALADDAPDAHEQ